jgi:hypothetical protein
MRTTGEQLQLDTDFAYTAIMEPDRWLELSQGFRLQTPDHRKFFETFIAEHGDRWLTSDWVEFVKEKHPEFRVLLQDIIRNGKPLGANGEALRGSAPLGSLSEYLPAVERFIRRYVAFPSEREPVAVALWIAHAWLIERFEVSPILAVTSAEMRSGKTLLLDLLNLLVPRPWKVISPTEAVTFRVLSERPHRTFLLDEGDGIWNPRGSERSEALRIIINSGNIAGTPVPRVRMNRKGVEGIEEFDCYGPKCIALIGGLPSTIADRSIPIRLKRRAPNEKVSKFRRRIATAEAKRLMFDWEGVTLVTDVSIPDQLNDRASDSWEPLLQIADTARGDWPDRARRAAIALSVEEDHPSVGMKLLADIREVFGDDSHLETVTLLDRLHNLEDSPWCEWYGKPLTARGLAKLLEPYRVQPMQKRVGGGRGRGYFRVDFEDAWRRYTPLRETETNVTTETLTDAVTDVTHVTIPQEGKPDSIEEEPPF